PVTTATMVSPYFLESNKKSRCPHALRAKAAALEMLYLMLSVVNANDCNKLLKNTPHPWGCFLVR
ncbi:hypothetical protein BTA51_27150, partial [Hahella sp. CCB-MM4]|uniref:hypothetical protein n=1 Tax=Hahella sp. (strain CCB-MM4) TaxID=1926491 RepID=UPI000BD020C1